MPTRLNGEKRPTAEMGNRRHIFSIAKGEIDYGVQNVDVKTIQYRAKGE